MVKLYGVTHGASLSFGSRSEQICINPATELLEDLASHYWEVLVDKLQELGLDPVFLEDKEV